MLKKNAKRPNFLIVGAAKSGTTSLYEYLKQHPQIFMPAWKELSFFIGDPNGPLHKVKKEKYYDIIFTKADDYKAVGEASTSYLYDKDAPGIIKNSLGKIKILIMLRDPVQMSYSLYRHQFYKEGETINTLEEALDAEQERIKDPLFAENCYGWHANYYYFDRGLYYQQVKRYIDVFGKSNVLIFLFEEFTRDPVGVSQQIYKFLEVDDSFIPIVKIHNPGGEILKIPRFWKDKGLFIKTASFILSKNLFKKLPHLKRTLQQNAPPPMLPETNQKLRTMFYDDVCRLEKLTGKDLSAWKIQS